MSGLATGLRQGLGAVERAYAEQCAAVEDEGGQVVLMSRRELARIASGPRDYARVYRQTMRNLQRPAIIHWLGGAFDPALAGYWGHADLDRAAEACLEIIAANVSWVDGIKVSLLDERREVELRRRLPAGVRMYTGDDFNFPRLIEADEQGHSHALLGIFDPIAPAASAALQALDLASDRMRHVLALAGID